MLRELNCGVVLAVLVAAACAERTEGAAPPAGRDKGNAMSDDAATNEAAGGDGLVRDLPSSFGKGFATLDEYLAHLQQYAGPVDLPWYRKVGPDSYELVTTIVPRGQPKVYTRAELMRQYGFTR